MQRKPEEEEEEEDKEEEEKEEEGEMGRYRKEGMGRYEKG